MSLVIDGTNGVTMPVGSQSNASIVAWVNWDGSTGSGNTIRASYNVSSITRTATGNYTITFSTALQDTNYAFSGSGQNDATNTNVVTSSTTARTTTNLYIVTSLPGLSTGNPLTVNVIVVR